MQGATATFLHVAGTRPRAGKTAFAAALLGRLQEIGTRAVGVKPIETGCARGEDHDLVGEDGSALRRAAGMLLPPVVSSPYRFTERASAAVAAGRAGLALSLDEIAESVRSCAGFAPIVIVEGTHGPLSPIASDALELDLAARLGAALLIVAEDRLGAESEALLAIEAARLRALRVVGVVLRETDGDPGTATVVHERGGVHVFPRIPAFEGDAARVSQGILQHLREHRIAEAILEAMR